MSYQSDQEQWHIHEQDTYEHLTTCYHCDKVTVIDTMSVIETLPTYIYKSGIKLKGNKYLVCKKCFDEWKKK